MPTKAKTETTKRHRLHKGVSDAFTLPPVAMEWIERIEMLARFGAMDAHIEDERVNPKPWITRPRWTGDKELDELYKIIKDDTYSPQSLRQLVAGVAPMMGRFTATEFLRALTILLSREVVRRALWQMEDAQDGSPEG